MSKKFVLARSLRMAMKDLKKHGVIDSPVFHVKSKNPTVPKIVYQPSFKNPAMPMEAIAANIRMICKKIDAEEVLTVSNTFLHSAEGDETPPREALIAVLERNDRIYSVLQPYKVCKDGKIQFDKKQWHTKDKAGPLGSFECLVQ